MRIFVFFIVLFSTITVLGGKLPTDEILNEGKLLYRLEKASWYSTDDFLLNYPHLRDSISGYISYEEKNHQIITVFYSKSIPCRPIIRYFFDSIPEEEFIRSDLKLKTLTQKEKDLITIRKDAIQRLSENENGFFVFNNNTSFNPIPLINDKGRRVFVLTGPQVSDVVILGNDYLLTYNKKNRFVKQEKLHNTLLEFPYTSGDPENELLYTMHSHVLSKFINSTDICTLLLYKDHVKWTQHYVISKKYVSIFDMQSEVLIILKKSAWDKIMNHKADEI